MKAKGTKLIKTYLNPNNEDERRVLDYLMYAGIPNSHALIHAVLFYLDAKDGKDDNSRLVEQVKAAVRESVQGMQIARIDDVPCSQPGQQEAEEPVSMLDFIEALEGGPSLGT